MPVIIKNIFNETVLNLTCEADGHPSPQYQWFKNGKVISRKNYIIIKKINSTETGDYRCQVNNDVGTLSTQTSSSTSCEFVFIVAAVQRCSVKKLVLIISQNSQEDIFARVSFFACNFIKKETVAQVFSFAFLKFLRPPFLQNTSCDCFWILSFRSFYL